MVFFLLLFIFVGHAVDTHNRISLLYMLVVAAFHGNKFNGKMPASVCDNSDKANPPGKMAFLTADCWNDDPIVCSCCDYCGET